MKAQAKFVELDSMYLGLIAYIKKVSDAYINRFGNNSMAVYSVKDLTDNCPSFDVMNFWKYETKIKIKILICVASHKAVFYNH